MKILTRIAAQASHLWRRAWSILDRQRDELAGSTDSSGWLIMEAVVYSANVGFLDHAFRAELWYEYHAEGEYWSGSCLIPFADQESAQDYAASRPAGSKILIRYRPGDTGRSVMLEKDQADANPLAACAQTTEL